MMADLSKKKRLTFNIFGISNEQRVFLDNDSYPFLRHVLSPSHRVTNKKEAVLLLLVPVVCTHSVPKVKSPLYWITDYHVSLNHQDKKSYSHRLFRLYRFYIYFRSLELSMCHLVARNQKKLHFFFTKVNARIRDENIN